MAGQYVDCIAEPGRRPFIFIYFFIFINLFMIWAAWKEWPD